ncbi:LOW QUALITY PROTEIN: Protein CBR-NHR-102 [Caenorhabditis briggsae]|uniref:Protein CBR-NHR-102 n=1 Tax=Caenorhabditis briggsae TaxID=6238 RepID=A8Y393_CAEBR|nr:LOW QUALITY PROTEIN: Protein CBR-NHR-102 [Caenorhabditis briggsae]CAP39362.1 Protein CBR-NHR-102 [Caenorhabditis briggsae]
MSSVASPSDCSSESSTSPTTLNGPICKICGLTAHGLHFGVLTCRACAAFFRRTVVMERDKKYKCRGGEDRCAVSSTDRYQCRLCRFNKCVELGMTPENVQWNRDSIPTSRKRKEDEPIIPANDLKALSYPESSLLGKPRTIMDITILASKIKEILNEKSGGIDAITKKMNTLEIADYGLKKWRNQQRSEEKMKLEVLPVRQMFAIFEKQMIVVAEWLIQQPDFRLLDATERWQFFKCVWNMWRRFERFEMSVKMFGMKTVNEKKFAISNEQVINVGFHIDFTEITDIPNEKVQQMFRDSMVKLFHEVAKPLFELRPSSVEMAYMLTQMSWQVAGKQMQGKVVEIGERVCDEMANNLHSYYLKEEMRSNYAGRLVRLMSVVNAVKKIHMERRKTMELARIFEVFKVEFSEPDIFDC